MNLVFMDNIEIEKKNPPFLKRIGWYKGYD